jgi:hypothetical protein
LEAYLKLFEMKTKDEALATIREIYRAKVTQDAGAMQEAVRAAIEAEPCDVEEVWEAAAEIVSKRVMGGYGRIYPVSVSRCNESLWMQNA